MASETGERAQRAARSAGLRRLAGAGLVGYALLHLLVAWLALQLAWGSALSRPEASTDQGGALRLLARSPGGDVLLWLLVAGLAGLCLWQAVELLRHRRGLPGPGRERRGVLVQLVKTVGTAVFYGYLAVAAGRAALGPPPDQGDADRQAVRGVLSWPGGQLLVVAVGLVVVGIGVYHVQKGLRSRFLDEIDLPAHPRPLRALVHRWSQAGFALKGVALVLVGAVMAWAAATFDPEQATGLDGALRAVAMEPYGAWGLTAVAVGLASFAVYCLARARHPVG
ncbi:DUF1206 domain-containing protein [Geodermatophilus sp. SYSU D00758]